MRHEAAQKMRVWPLGVGLQEQASKHLKLLWSKAMVVSVEEKVPPDGISCESERRAQANHAMRCRKLTPYSRACIGAPVQGPAWKTFQRLTANVQRDPLDIENQSLLARFTKRIRTMADGL